jgi:hypothetical protein
MAPRAAWAAGACDILARNSRDNFSKSNAAFAFVRSAFCRLTTTNTAPLRIKPIYFNITGDPSMDAARATFLQEQIM